jgi:EXS family
VFVFIWTGSLLLFLLSCLPDILPGLRWLIPGSTDSADALDPSVWPLSLVAIYLLVLVVQQWKADWWLVRTLSRIAVAPFRTVVFRDFFLADQVQFPSKGLPRLPADTSGSC